MQFALIVAVPPARDWPSMHWLRFQTIGLACAGFVLAVLLVRPAACSEGKAAEAFSPERLRSFVAQYCAKCHFGDDAQADLRLDRYADLASILADRDRWEKVLEYVQSGIMPPDDEPRPEGNQVEALAAWLSAEFARADALAPASPGRVTIRRLNRAEYNNTIRDLLGIDFEPARDFPADEVGYGFDNIGDVLALPPALLEKYLSAAEEIASRAIMLGPPRIPRVKLEPGDLQRRRGVQSSGVFASSGELFTEFEAREGQYAIRIEAFGQQAGDEPARMALSIDKQEIATFDVTAVESQPGVYENRVALSSGTHRIAVSFVNDYWKPEDPDPNNRDRNLILRGIEIEGPLDCPPELPDSHRRILTCVPAAEASSEEFDRCARQVLTPFCSRAFRREVSAEEVERLVGLVRLARNEGESFERGIQLAMQAVLVSPHFLFRVELDPGAGQGNEIHAISDYELASRLSYFLWSSMPDEELFELAAAGKLREPQVLESQVRRMLADPKSRALVENFTAGWLQIGNLTTVSPNPKQFPSFDPAMRLAMRKETELFFEAILREDRSVLEFLDADFTFVNEKLARHYGIAGIQGEAFQRVSTAGTPRGGLLTQASILTVTSNPTRTSPVKRGKWILEQILGTPPPPPPPGVSELKDDPKVDQSASLRVRLEQHRQNQSCAACHKRMDPLGFGLENFDPIGAWRERDGENPIDATGELPDGTRFDGPSELRKILLDRAEEFRRCLAAKMLTYALGRGPHRADRRAIDEICQALRRDGDKFSRLVLAIVESEPFQMRHAEQSATQNAEATGG
jgi:mono/diheme cytochrome c family protein